MTNEERLALYERDDFWALARDCAATIQMHETVPTMNRHQRRRMAALRKGQ